MFIKCQNCGTENPLGSIFCRSCGVKLATENLEKELEKHQHKKTARKNIKAVFRFIMILVLMAVLYLLYAAVDPFGKSVNDNLVFTPDVKQQAISKYSSMQQRDKDFYSFSPQQIDFIANKYFTRKAGIIFIDIVNNSDLSFTVRKDVIKKYLHFKVSIKATCKPYMVETKSGKEILSLKLQELKIGDLYVPERFHEYILPEFKPYYATGTLKRFIRKIKDIKIKDGQVEFYLYPKKI